MNDWAGRFGDDYTMRNKEDYSKRLAFWDEFLNKYGLHLEGVTEFGCGAGANLSMIKELCPRIETIGVDINSFACQLARANNVLAINEDFLSDSYENWQHDLVFTCGFLIHLTDEQLEIAYKNLYDATKQYILIMEYFSPEKTEIPYRDGVYLHKRDFCKEIRQRYPNLGLVDYGFIYEIDGFDNLNWFLLYK